MNFQDASNAAEGAQTLRDALNAANDASRTTQNATQSGDAGAPGTTSGSQPIIITQDGERPVSIDMKDGNLVISQAGNTKVIPWREAVPAGAVQIAWTIPATLFILLIGWPLTRAAVGWIRRRSAVNQDTAALEARLQARFASMETNIDTVAVEMEKLAEGQRFTNRLISERPVGAVPVPASANMPVGAARP